MFLVRPKPCRSTLRRRRRNPSEVYRTSLPSRTSQSLEQTWCCQSSYNYVTLLLRLIISSLQRCFNRRCSKPGISADNIKGLNFATSTCMESNPTGLFFVPKLVYTQALSIQYKCSSHIHLRLPTLLRNCM